MRHSLSYRRSLHQVIPPLTGRYRVTHRSSAEFHIDFGGRLDHLCSLVCSNTATDFWRMVCVGRWQHVLHDMVGEINSIRCPGKLTVLE